MAERQQARTLLSIDGRVVIVTGGAKGIGRVYSERMAEAGAKIVVADIDGEANDATVAAIRAAGGQAVAATTDVSDEAAAARMAETALGAFGRIDALINNASLMSALARRPWHEIPIDEWDRVMAVNLKGPWLVVRACSPYLGEGSRVVNLSSATVYSGSEQWAHYVASKGGVIALTRVMAKELGRRSITVNALAPGFTLTEASYGLMENADEYGVDRGALRRASRPGDIVGAVLFLAGPDSAFITGQTLVVDGGRQFI